MNRRPQILLAHPGTQHAFRLAQQLQAHELLAGFWTGFALPDTALVRRMVHVVRKVPGIGGVRSRVAAGLAADRVHAQPVGELAALWQLKRGHEAHQVLHARNRRFQERIPESALRAADAIIGFDTSSWILAQRTRAAGRKFLLDRTIAHPGAVTQILEQLHRAYPEWQARPDTRPPCVVEAEEREHALADRIVVGGSFARNTLITHGAPAEKVVINAYGVDWGRFAAAGRAPRGDRPLRFLFVGSLIGRKGVPILLDAWRRLAAPAELWLVGPCGQRERSLIPDLPGLRVVGKVPHSDLPGVYANADVLVLPSLVEGFGLVLLEALAAGLAIVSTPNTGAIDLVRDPVLGRVVPAGSVEALAEALALYLKKRPDRTEIQRVAAPLEAEYSWAAYGARWAALLQEVCS